MVIMVLFSVQASLPSSIYTYDSGQDDALVTLCSFDHAAFNELHILFMNSLIASLHNSKSGFMKRMKKKG
jgi:hypothetical protein